MIYAIRKKEEEIDQVDKQRIEAANYYLAKMGRMMDAVDTLKSMIAGYLDAEATNKVATHLGTAFVTKRTKIDWPEDEKIVTYMRDEGIYEPAKLKGIVREVPKVDKAALKKAYMDKLRKMPGLQEQTITSLAIRDVKSNEVSDPDQDSADL